MSSQDAFCPLVLFQFLEECWQQDYSRRPSADNLHKSLSALTGFSIEGEQVTRVPQRVLMDSYILHHSYRHMVSTTLCEESSFMLCAALSCPEDTSTSLVVVRYYQEDEVATGLEMQVSACPKCIPVDCTYNIHVVRLH